VNHVRSFSQIAAALVFAAMLSGCAAQSQKVDAAAKDNKGRKAAPNFTLKDADGRNVSLSDYKGKVVLLNFWATWCGPCKIEIPWFIEFEQKYKDRGFAVLGVSMDEEGWEAVRPYLQKTRINYRVVIGTDTVAQSYGGVESLPTTFVIDKDGRINSTHIGLVSKSDYENEIVQLLDGRSADAAGSSRSGAD
jgi:cytochrome c biogenesis protein CcmG/thiol:disulfide interchange protein DsbE